MRKEFNFENVRAYVEAQNEAISIKVTPRVEGKIFYFDFVMDTTEEQFSEVVIDLRFPFENMHSLWLPSLLPNAKNIRAKGILELEYNMCSHIASLAPVGSFFSLEGNNKIAFAFSDCKNIVVTHPGAYEEEEVARVMMKLFTVPLPKCNHYEATLRMDLRDLPFYKTIQEIAHWYDELLGHSAMQVPECAREAVYSTWYAFLQNITDKKIEEQCKFAVEAGCKTVIVDDGWQTDDNNRGYAYCGDWKVTEKRFPDFKAHVQKVHEMGMKFMLWLSVPFVGPYVHNIEEYKDVMLLYKARWNTYVLDPRYKKARDFLVNTYVDLVTKYDLDGLKLDFIDEFDMRQADDHAKSFDPKRDTQSLPEGVDMLMMEVRNRLEQIKPDIMIEFRQNYIGPMIRKYGNMFRAHDCPNDILMNRMTIIDLRLLSGNTAVHSDMTIWSPSDSNESVALNFINTLYSVPQISPNFTHLPKDQVTLTKFWLKFWNEHKKTLLDGELSAFYPESQYSLISALKDGECVKTVGEKLVVDIFNEDYSNLFLVNGAMATSMVTRFHKTVSARVEIIDCLGNCVDSYDKDFGEGLAEIAVPKSGIITITTK